MTSFDDYVASLRLRDIVAKMVRDELDTRRPSYRFAQVMSIDRDNFSCTVQYPGETSEILVRMGATQPKTVGQIVKVDGLPGERFIVDVMGEPYFWPQPRAAATEITDANLALDPGDYFLRPSASNTPDDTMYWHIQVRPETVLGSVGWNVHWVQTAQGFTNAAGYPSGGVHKIAERRQKGSAGVPSWGAWSWRYTDTGVISPIWETSVSGNTTGVTGWGRIQGRHCVAAVTFVLTNAQVDGNITNVQVAQIADDRFRPLPGTSGQMTTYTTGPGMFAYVDSNGKVFLVATAGALAAGATVNLVGNWSV